MEMQQVNNQNSYSQIQKSSEKMRILVVDDNATCLTIVAAILRKLSHQVVTAKHPADALCALRTMEFDLVVVDVHMPDINGFELQQLIHSEFQLPVILMSADDRAVNIWKENHKQVAHFILKPVSIEDMKFLVKYAEEYWMNKNQGVKRIMYNRSSRDGDNDDRENTTKEGTSSGTKKHKKVWTEELHSKFVEAIQFLGPERAIPRNIVKMMNEPGLTRENVASHLQLVQTWIPTFCTTPDIKCVPLLGAKFAMHGLWPAGISGKSVENCGQSPVPEHVFRELQADLHRTWPPIVLGRQERSLWSHEWKVHGTCAYNMSQKSYFEAAIKNKNGIDLLSLLVSANITPTMDRTYKIKDIIEAVQRGPGGVGINNNVYVSCREVNTTHVWLREIFVCVKTSKTKSKDYVSCPASSDTRGCGGQKKRNNIILPTARTLMLSTDHLHYEYKGESSIAERLEGEI